MRLLPLLLAALLACAAAVRADDSDAEAEELFTSLFKAEEATTGTRSTAGTAWLAGAYGVQSAGGYYYYGYHPSASPGTSPEQSTEQSPEQSPEQSTEQSTEQSSSPSPSAPPGDVAGQTGDTTNPAPLPPCQGVAYDAYLTSCMMWADANADGVRDSSEPSASVTSGTFVFATGTAATSLGTLHVLTAEESAGTVTSGSSVCHDATTLLAVHFPYAAPRPDSCSAAFVVTPLTSLLVHGQGAGLAQSSVLAGLSLPSGFALLTTDSLKGATAGDAGSNKVYRREVQLLQLTLTCAKFLTKKSTHLASARLATLQSLAQHLMAGSGRRLLTTTAIDLTQGSAIQTLMQTANTIASGSIPAADLTVLTADMLAVVANATAALNSIIETSTDVTQIQKASVVGQTMLADNVQGLVNGTISTAQLMQNTSPQALQSAVSAATLPGEPVTTTEDKSNAVALGVGLGVGLGVPVLGAAGFAYWHYMVKGGGRTGSAALGQPMLD